MNVFEYDFWGDLALDFELIIDHTVGCFVGLPFCIFFPTLDFTFHVKQALYSHALLHNLDNHCSSESIGSQCCNIYSTVVTIKEIRVEPLTYLMFSTVQPLSLYNFDMCIINISM